MINRFCAIVFIIFTIDGLLFEPKVFHSAVYWIGIACVVFSYLLDMEEESKYNPKTRKEITHF